VHTELDFSERATLLQSAAGVFVADPETGLIPFFPTSGGAPVVPPSGAFVSPSGALVARAQAGELQLFRALEAGRAAPALSASGCSSLLAWSSEGEHIACAEGRSAPSSLRLWQAQAAPPALLALGPRRDADVIASPSFAGHRRVFSPSGTWLAVGAADALQLARPAPTARLAFSVPSSALGASASTLAFSPDESALIAGGANTLAWIDLAQGAASLRVLSAGALLEEGCSEDLLAGYGAWCGSASSAPNVSWSSGSELIAFRSALGTLQVIDVSRARDGVIGSPQSPDRSCSEACGSANNARFQP
jgi:WD40 repeat protein